MTDKFIKQIAELRAKELFTKEFFETCADSWYGDEFFEFKAKEVGMKRRNPTDDEAYKYMGYLQKLKDKYYDEFFTSENAFTQYSVIINKIQDILDLIEEGNNKYKAFECGPDITLKIKQVGNYFVDKYNEEYNIIKKKQK